MAIGDIYEATFVQNYTLGGEETMNKFYFRAATAEATAQVLYDGMLETDSIVERINAIQGDNMKNNRLRVVNLFSLTDFYEDEVAGQGDGAAQMLPPHSAVNFTLKLNTRGVRPGSKRISGILEAAQENGFITDSSTIGALNSIATWLSGGGWSLIAMDDFEPVVVKRVPYTIDGGLPTEREAARLPTNVGELNYGVVVAALVNLRVSHQVSRGNGR